MHIPRATIRIRRKILPLAWFFELGRLAVITLLVSVAGIGIVRYVQHSSEVSALEFTQRIVGDLGAAEGVLSVAVADMQRDGRQDIVSAGRDGVNVYIRQGNGTFKKKIIDEVRGERIIIRDFNKDGLQDMLVSVDANPSVKIYLNNGDTEFSKTWIGTGSRAAIAAGDIDGDGAVDIVTSTEQGGEFVLQRWMNNGTGTFTATTLGTNTGVRAIAIADINNNHYQDIIIGGSQGLQHYDTSNGYSWNRADIDDTDQTTFSTISVGDVNGDSDTDIVIGDQSSDTVAYYRHLQHSSFERIEVSTDTDAAATHIIDFNEDGYTDIIATSQDEDSVYWFQNDGKDSFTRHTIATSLQSVFGFFASDIDGDNDFDFVAGDHFRGTIYWYERTHAKPTASAPSEIAQMTDGSGRIIFTTSVAQQDSFRTSLRVQYSLDGVTWYKAYISNAKTDKGKIDVNHDNAYQIGTSNPIDTDIYSAVKLTLTWDTKSTKNLGNPIVSDLSNVRIRLTPKDSVGLGATVASQDLRIDNGAPRVSGGLTATSSNNGSVELSWSKPQDRSSISYRVYYGTDSEDVRNQSSDAWDDSNDAPLNESDTTSTTITGLSAGGEYTFKLVAKDNFGNESAWPATSVTAPSSSAGESPTPTVSPTPTGSPDLGAIVGENSTPSPTPVPTIQSRPPIADAGPNQIVNPSALVILDGSASSDFGGGSVSYIWKQLAGPGVELLSDRTATPSFSAGADGGTYIFQLTVKDTLGASALDLVTVSVKPLPEVSAAPIVSSTPLASVVPNALIEQRSEFSLIASGFLKPINTFLFIVALILTSFSVVERVMHGLSSGSRGGARALGFDASASHGKVAHYKTGVPIAGAQVMIYGPDGKLRSTERTNEKGEFPSSLPVGEYTFGVHAPGFIFSTSASATVKPSKGIVYTGGKVSITDPSKPISLIIPMKPSRQEVTSLASSGIHLWQSIQWFTRIISWPIFIAGSLCNTALVFLEPGFLLLGLEVMYVVLIIVKLVLEVRVGPAYGLVRNAITHIPLDLAIVRLFDQSTNRLVMTRIANAEGKFFALPSSGTYMISVTKPGYAPFSRENVVINSGSDSVLQITADLMPLVPVAGERLASVKMGVI